MLHLARKIGLLITLFAVAGFAASETLVLNNPTDPPLTNEHGSGFLDRLAQEAVLAADAGQLFRLLAKDRVDFVLYSSLMGPDHLRKYGPGDAKLVLPPVETREMFIYLHKSRAHVAPPITAAMRAMKEDGTYDRFFRESFQ